LVEDPLNKDCFVPPKRALHEAAARGFDPRTKVRNGGMTRMAREHLGVGRHYYRFCDRDRFNRDWKSSAMGGWWADAEVFATIQSFAREHAHIQEFARRNGQNAISYAAQLHFAVPYEWGDCGAIVCARLAHRLDAWRGTGDIAYLSGGNPAKGGSPSIKGGKTDPRDGGAKYIPLQKTGIFQLYIPDLRVHFDRAFKLEKKGHASWFA
jgi:hypothetical protein